MLKGKILVVDDEQNILDLVVYNLQAAGYKTITAEDGKEAIEKARTGQPDLIILDVMLPEMDGFEILSTIRKETQVPVIMLTAKKEEIDKVLGLEMGADDYLTKPFSPRELTARVKAILRRSGESEAKITQGIIVNGKLRIDTIKHQVFYGDKEVDLTAKEFDLLKLLITSPGRVFSRESLLQNLWDYDYYGDTKTIDVHIRHLRMKIEEDPANPKFIKTVRGVGYKFQE
jgi:DNA-binding response OmpR family regulator